MVTVSQDSPDVGIAGVRVSVTVIVDVACCHTRLAACRIEQPMVNSSPKASQLGPNWCSKSDESVFVARNWVQRSSARAASISNLEYND